MSENNPKTENLPARTVLEFPETLPLLLLEDQVIFPMTLAPLLLTDKHDRQLVDDTVKGHGLLALTTMRDPENPDQGLSNAHDIGCIGRILQVQYNEEGHMEVVVQTLKRFRIGGLIRRNPYIIVRVDLLKEAHGLKSELEPMALTVKMQMARLIALSPAIPDNATAVLEHVEEPGFLADLVAGNISLPLEEKQKLLSSLDPAERLRRLMYLLQNEIERMEISTKIHEDVKSSIDKGQREYFLRQQLKAIQEELGEGEGQQPEVVSYREKIEALELTAEVQKEALREVDRLSRMSEASAEYHVISTYLDTLVELPWNKFTKDRLNIKQADRVLNEDHYGLDKVKKRILEYLAVRKLKPDAPGPILCFYGPPGVGKTSLGKSIARALGRKYVRMSLGGVRDEAEIRGHRKTYVGALPGRILQGIRRSKSSNPVFILDEIDKVGSDFRGDPSSALLEVLDPAQNNSFVDHYLNVPYDLSKVMFVATANTLDTIPWALRDRMEIIEITSYTLDEKLEIAKRYLVPRQVEAHGLSAIQLRFNATALRRIISDYTREAGVRNLEREIAHVCRGCARKFAARKRKPIRIGVKELREYLGNEKNFYDSAERTRLPGVVIGLAWTPTGGDILFIEATRMRGKGELILTGQLGDVMKESVRTALSYLQANADDLGIDEKSFKEYDLHVHVPAGAVRKDGPSAGVAMLTAITSLMLEKKVKSNLAMTGEITLRGNVLPVGGVKEKVLAAIRANVKTVILPERCRNDLDDIPPEVREKITVQFVKQMHEVLELALGLKL
jgi:ATP-dependent Lon protease